MSNYRSVIPKSIIVHFMEITTIILITMPEKMKNALQL